MATTMKGIYKGFKYITQIFVVKEREMEIGYPTDVKHVAHIGWDGPPGSGPSWMNDFKTTPDFSTSLGSLSERREHPNPMSLTAWSTQDFDQSAAHQPQERPSVTKKQKRKKTKSLSSPKSASTTRHSRAAKPKPIA
ncbi:hypothetical protein L6164_032184 [Bauhinia variegata]|uniref:Uncharacterized protein n=1 Tax=Bauhinia variegata TaxID=167791 RepID=A0ACB9KNC2_BAUVA|nr:hypothetical protein L6164_032184 [Bauhinia variegata]